MASIDYASSIITKTNGAIQVSTEDLFVSASRPDLAEKAHATALKDAAVLQNLNKLADRLSALANANNIAIVEITSGYRDVDLNRNAGGVTDSFHLSGLFSVEN